MTERAGYFSPGEQTLIRSAADQEIEFAGFWRRARIAPVLRSLSVDSAVLPTRCQRSETRRGELNVTAQRREPGSDRVGIGGPALSTQTPRESMQ